MVFLVPYQYSKIWNSIAAILTIIAFIEGYFDPLSLKVQHDNPIWVMLLGIIIITFVIGFTFGNISVLFFNRKPKWVRIMVFHFYLFPLYYASVVSIIGYPFIRYILHYDQIIGLSLLPLSFGMQLSLYKLIRNEN